MILRKEMGVFNNVRCRLMVKGILLRAGPEVREKKRKEKISKGTGAAKIRGGGGKKLG